MRPKQREAFVRSPAKEGVDMPFDSPDRTPWHLGADGRVTGSGTKHVAFVLSGLGAGGAERVISLIASIWVERGIDVTVITFDAADDIVYHPFDPRVRLVRLGIAPARRGGLAAVQANYRRVRALRSALRRLRPDVLIAFLTKINALTLVAAKGLGCPVIVSERNNPHRQAAHPLWNLALQRLYRHATAVVMQTSASLACLPPEVRRRATVIPNPVLPANMAGRSPERPVLVAAGRLVPQKGFDLLIEAFARVAGDHKAWSLVIWGEGPDRAAIEAHVQALGMSERVRLPGLSDTPGGWMADATAFVLASRFEGFPNVLAEAMAVGLPVVAFDCPFGPGEMIAHEVDGLLVGCEDVPALATALSRIMGDPTLRNRLGTAARVSAMRFAPQRIVEQWDALIGRAADGAAYGRPAR